MYQAEEHGIDQRSGIAISILSKVSVLKFGLKDRDMVLVNLLMKQQDRILK